MRYSTVVADASVVIPWMHGEKEPFREDCWKLYRDFVGNDVRIVVPPVFFYEMSNFAVMRGRKGFYPKEHLEELLSMDFVAYQFQTPDFITIAQLAHDKGITAYDASYFYLADALESPLLTVDKSLARAWGGRPGGHIQNYDRLRSN